MISYLVDSNQMSEFSWQPEQIVERYIFYAHYRQHCLANSLKFYYFLLREKRPNFTQTIIRLNIVH